MEASGSSSEQVSSYSQDLAKAMSNLALNLSKVAQGELGSVNLHAELLEKLNLKTAAEYDDYADFASGLQVFVQRLKNQNEGLCSHLQVINDIDREVRQLEAVVSTLDNYTSNLEAKIRAREKETRRPTTPTKTTSSTTTTTTGAGSSAAGGDQRHA